MHTSSILRMQWFVQEFAEKKLYRDQKLHVLDVGSHDLNGSYRTLFAKEKFHYVGLDLENGPNVDLVLSAPYDWSSVPTESFDIVISGQAFEHSEFFWILMEEMTRVLKKDGMLCMIAPRGFSEHRYPVDCYRFLTDGAVALARYTNLRVLHAHTNLGPDPSAADWFSRHEADCMVIATKPYSELPRLINRKQYSISPPDHATLSAPLVSASSQPETVRSLSQLLRKLSVERRFEEVIAIASSAAAEALSDPEIQYFHAAAAALHAPQRMSPPRKAQYHISLAQAADILGKQAEALAHYQKAIATFPSAHTWDHPLDTIACTARLGALQYLMPGPNYLDWLSRLHRWIAPALYLEIGLFEGRSLSRAFGPTYAIGIDPDPRIEFPCYVPHKISRMTSDAYFRSPESSYDLRDGINFAFIDGDHEFGQVVRDFYNIERYCAKDAVIAIHDTLPTDAAMTAHPRRTSFYTGDVWKIVPFLKATRPDLNIFTIKTAFSGLTIILGADPANAQSLDTVSAAAAPYKAWQFSHYVEGGEHMLNVIPNDEALVRDRLMGYDITADTKEN